MTYIQEFDGNVKATGVATDTLFYEQRATKGLVFRVGEADVGVVGYNGNVKHIYIPDFWNGLPITYIDVHAFQNAGIVSVRLPKHLELVDDYAFAGCSSLASIDLGEEISRIGENAFDGCSSLAKVKIGATVLPSYDETSFGELATNPKLIRPAKVETAVAWEQIADTFGFELVVDYFNGNAETSTSAVQDGAGNNIAEHYAQKTGTYQSMTVGNAVTASKATTTDFTYKTWQPVSGGSLTLTAGAWEIYYKGSQEGTTVNANFGLVYFDGTTTTTAYTKATIGGGASKVEYYLIIGTNGNVSVYVGDTQGDINNLYYREIN